MNNFSARRFITLFLPISILSIIACVFAPVLQAGFLDWDDGKHLIYNPYIYHLTFSNIVQIFKQAINNTYIPLTSISFAVEHLFAGLNPKSYHATNLLLHGFNALLVFAIARKLDLTFLAAAVASLFFAIHPMRVESVAWITERKDVLFALFYFCSVYFYLIYIKKKRFNCYFLSLLCGLLSVLAKPMALSLPWVLWVFDWLLKRKFERKLIFEKLPYFLLIEPIAWITFQWLERTHHYIFPDSILIGIWSATYYLKQLFLPGNLLPIYAPPWPVSLSNMVYVQSILIFAIFILCLVIPHRLRYLKFGCLFYASTMFFLFRGDFNDINVVADRFMYVPTLGFALWIGVWISETMLKKEKGYKFLIAGLLTAYLSILSVQTNIYARMWQDSETLWRWVHINQPHNFVAQQKLKEIRENTAFNQFDFSQFDQWISENPSDATLYAKRGQELFNLKHYPLAYEDFNRAIALNSSLKEPYCLRGRLEYFRGNFDAALADFNRALNLDPQFPLAHYYLADFFKQKGDFKEALSHYNTALEHDPELFPALVGRSDAYVQIMEHEKALNDLKKAVTIAEDYTEAYYAQASIYKNLKQYTQAIAAYEKIIHYSPQQAKAHNEIGAIYFKLGQWSKAEQYFQQTIKIDPYYEPAYNNMALVCIRKNEFAQAINYLTQAIRFDPYDIKGYITRGDVYLVLNKDQQALEDYNQVIRLKPTENLGYLKRSQYYRKQKEYRKAKEDLKKARELGLQIDMEKMFTR